MFLHVAGREPDFPRPCGISLDFPELPELRQKFPGSEHFPRTFLTVDLQLCRPGTVCVCQNSQNAQEWLRRVLKVIWCLWAERVPKESLAPCKPCFAPGETAQTSASHRATDCFGALTPEARKHALSLSNFGRFASFDTCDRPSGSQLWILTKGEVTGPPLRLTPLVMLMLEAYLSASNNWSTSLTRVMLYDPCNPPTPTPTLKVPATL